MARIARLAGIAVSVGDEGSRGDGHFFFLRPTYTDTAVVHPSAPGYLRLAHRPLAATLQRERDKIQSYGHAAILEGADFLPTVFETFGAVGPSAVKFINRLADEVIGNGTSTMEDQPTKAFIYRSIAATIQKGNAQVLLTGARRARSRLSSAYSE